MSSRGAGTAAAREASERAKNVLIVRDEYEN